MMSILVRSSVFRLKSRDNDTTTMCGIHVVVSRKPDVDTTILPSQLKQCLCNRGPDHFGQVTTRLTATTPDAVQDVSLTFTSTVLSLRGDHVTRQPFQDSRTGSVLCWNGEAWQINERPVEGNDGEAIFALLTEASKKWSMTGSNEHILDVFRSTKAITGPFAFVYFDGPSETLYFGRDRLGRRSLLICRDETDGSFVLSSIAEACQADWKEVESDGIYSVALRQASPSPSFPSPVRHSWRLPVEPSGHEHAEAYVSSPLVTSRWWPFCQTHFSRFWGSPSSTQTCHKMMPSLSVVSQKLYVHCTDS
jgi:asparagine synthetase B (glutamine-hydrolysing)